MKQSNLPVGFTSAPVEDLPVSIPVPSKKKSAKKVSMTPQLVQAIKKAPKGVIPAGLAKYLANRKANQSNKK